MLRKMAISAIWTYSDDFSGSISGTPILKHGSHISSKCAWQGWPVVRRLGMAWGCFVVFGGSFLVDFVVILQVFFPIYKWHTS
jgi:hypothetical protein